MSKTQSVARQRWFLVKEVLKSNRNSLSQSKLSGRKFSGYSLMFREVPSIDANQAIKASGENGSNDYSWQTFSVTVEADKELCKLVVRIYSDRVTVEDLTGFNNTGNVCIWPSEDVLAHYLATEVIPKSHFKRVCEIGGGMTSLAGLAAACLGDFEEILLTDGNDRSVANVQAIIERNRETFRTKSVHARRLRWDQLAEDDKDGSLSNHFDLVICADCLFFKEFQSSLVDTILRLLSNDGTCYIVAPSRGGSLTTFVELARSRMNSQQPSSSSYEVTVSERYDEPLWNAYQHLLTSSTLEYNPDQHYPMLITITKTRKE